MKLYEFVAKQLFRKYGIATPEGEVADTPESAAQIAGRLGRAVIKAQVLTGGRGKAGGIAPVTQSNALETAKRILGMSIRGLQVRKLLVEEDKSPEKELYLGITIDRGKRRPVLIASRLGGVDIEEAARKAPGSIIRTHIDPLAGLFDYQVRTVSRRLGTDVGDVAFRLYRLFIERDCTLAEINPLGVVADGSLCALDAKITVDDSALFRQPFMEEESGSPEAIAKKHGMSYVALDGNIGCIVNGAGLAMASMDLIKGFGGEPANFMDVRGGAGAEDVADALSIVTSNPNVRAVLVNIFGGITRCDEIAVGIRDFRRRMDIRLPVVVRLTGTGEAEARRLLLSTGVIAADSSEDGARQVVALAHQP
ncbi:MAG TPA: ADP-forming succinate--CoA ligase subunit beta [Candidatus Methanoperedenaceae archaeon]|nr:ADP-forming succinate--CoA ligase subunit beta [Candidatus Methanoperedenaceae archaeon]